MLAKDQGISPWASPWALDSDSLAVFKILLKKGNRIQKLYLNPVFLIYTKYWSLAPIKATGTLWYQIIEFPLICF